MPDLPDLTRLTEYLPKLEASFGLPDGFLIGLLFESDDWSFTIKTHSLIEAAVTQAVIAEVGDARLEEIIRNLPVLGRHSKASYAEALGIIRKREGDFLKRLSKIRNHVVHRLEAVSFTFGQYIASLAEQDREATLRELLFLGGGPKGPVGKTFALQPKLVIWAHALAVVVWVVAAKARAEGNKSIRDTYRRVAEEILGPLQESER